MSHCPEARWRQISRPFAARQLCQQLCHALLPGISTLGAVQAVVDGEQVLPLEGRVERVGRGVLLQRRQKVLAHHHGGAAGVGAGPAPIAARGRYLGKWNQALQKRGVVQAFAQPVDPASANSCHHAIVPGDGGLASGRWPF